MKIVLYEKKEDCCACGACVNICPKQAISMKEDEAGYLYPEINEDLCIECGACKNVCAYQHHEESNNPIDCYAAVSKNMEQSEKSASAGIFSAIASKVLRDGGTVYGAAFDDDWNVSHIAVDSFDKLYKLQGSKYTHSNTGRTFSDVKKELINGRFVLYSGTPCQIAGLKQFLRKEYENLLTIDIVCHGVPSNKMLKDYIHSLEEKHKGAISQFSFRDKALGWGINGNAFINGKKIKLWQSASSYFYYFTKASLYRENCYSCKYTSSHRPADITLGDFWGIEKQHSDYLKDWDESKGISLIVANTIKGADYLKACDEYIELKHSSFDKVSAGNAQLRHPSHSGNRDEIVDLFVEKGWDAIECRFNNSIGVRRYSSQIKALLPSKIKKMLKRSVVR